MKPFFFLLLIIPIFPLLVPQKNCANKQLTSIEPIACSSNQCASINCDTCSSKSIEDCLLCKSGYTLSKINDLNGQCIKNCDGKSIGETSETCGLSNCGDINCMTCDKSDINKCLACKSKFAFKSEGSVCTSCSLIISNCVNCLWNQYCDECESFSDKNNGYLIVAEGTLTKCSVCDVHVENCNKCNGKTNKCEECTSGNYLKSDDKYGSCINCEVKNCEVCPEAATCKTCITGYYKESSPDKCSNCDVISNCRKCVNQNECTQCNRLFYLKTITSCDGCENIVNCIDCDGKTCTKCKTQNKLSDDKKTCIICTDESIFCDTCDGINCVKCLTDYILNENLVCKPKSEFFCSESDGIKCLKCDNLYILDDKSLCIKAPAECIETNGRSCSKCLDTMYLTNSAQCEECTKIKNCKQCDGYDCVLCEDKYFRSLTHPSQCILCNAIASGGLEGCNLCWTLKQCRKCENNYFLETSDNTCKNCFLIKNCLECDGYSCSKCIDGYYLYQNTCIKCSDLNCLSCPYSLILEKSECTVCKSGYYYTTNTCTACNKNIKGQKCIECSYDLKGLSYSFSCNKCESKYGVDLLTNECTQCSIEDCSECYFDSEMKCKTCVSGYYITSDFKCKSCGIINCDKCDSKENIMTCTKCINNYYLKEKECINCNENPGCTLCEYDSINKKIICSQCSQGFYLDPTTKLCKACSTQIEFCGTCSFNDNSFVCLSCKNFYYLQNPTKCSPCVDTNCMECVTRDRGKSCNKCIDGYYLNNKACLLCSAFSDPNCNRKCSFNKQFECIQCAKNYFVYPEKKTNCGKCSLNCDSCTNEKFCTVCQSDFYLKKELKQHICVTANECKADNYIVNESEKYCNNCNVLYNNCTTCDKDVYCKSCNTNFPGLKILLPLRQMCVNSSNTNIVNISENTCGTLPVVNKDNTFRGFSVQTFVTKVNVDCSADQQLRIYSVYFLKSHLLNSSIFTFEKVKEKFKDNKLNEFRIANENNDPFFINYHTILTNDKGVVLFELNNLKKSDEEYEMKIWCHNFGNDKYPLNIVSNEYSLHWSQNTNNGKNIKLFTEFGKVLSDDERKKVAIVFNNLLSIEENKNTFYTYDWRSLIGVINLPSKNLFQDYISELFYIVKDPLASYTDTSNEQFIKILNSSFIEKFNDNVKLVDSSLSLKKFSFLLMDSSLAFKQPTFKNIDFIQILTVYNTSISLNVSISNTNGYIYVGYSEDVSSVDVKWDNFIKGNLKENIKLNNFKKVFVNMNQVYTWNTTNLDPLRAYAVYFGGSNE